MMALDIIRTEDKTVTDRLARLGFSSVLYADKNGRLYGLNDVDPFELSVYGGKDYEFIIRKGKADAVTDTDANGFLLNKGLCSKLKENKMFVLFKFSSLVRSENFFRCYKNFMINGRVCNEYSVNCLFVSFAGEKMDVKSPLQLEYFARQFGYNYNNFVKAQEALIKRI